MSSSSSEANDDIMELHDESYMLELTASLEDPKLTASLEEPKLAASVEEPKLPRKLKINRRALHLSNNFKFFSSSDEKVDEATTTPLSEVKSEKRIIPLTYANGGIGKFWNTGKKAAEGSATTSTSASASTASTSSSAPLTNPSSTSSEAASTSSTLAPTISRCVYVTEKNVTVNVDTVSEEVEPPKKKHKPITWP